MCERVRLDIAYDGTDFSGWARQPELRTVQGVLEQALATIVQEPVQLTVAGRTDAGVHARGQVAHADLPMGLTRDPRLAYRLTRLASREGDVVVRRVSAVPDGFDARFSAIWRRYEYRLAIGELDPLERRTALHVPEPVDVEALQRASQTLLGLRDFAAFCKAREGATTIRDLRAFSWEPTAAGAIARLEADAFCHSMVRALVGAVLAVARGRLGLADLERIAHDGQRTSAFTAVPAHGLVLTEVGYPADDQLAAQAERARARRDVAEV